MNEQAEMVLAALPRLRRSAGLWVRGECPFCPARRGKTGGDPIGVNLSTGGYNCFRCGATGWAPIPDLPDDEPEPERPVGIRLPDGTLDLWTDDVWTSSVARKARTYLEGRGVGRELVEEARIGVVLRGYYGGRVVVPIWRGQELVGWAARDYTGKAERKYLYPRGMRRGEILYRGETLAVRTDDPAIVVEGTFDALPHLSRAVAVLGKPSAQHVEMLAAARRPIAVALDGDSWEEAEALALRLRLRDVRAGFVRLPPGTDPAITDPGWLRCAAARCIAD